VDLKAQLQRRILLGLDEGPADSITALAEKVKAQRPSVSRAIHVLEETGMVVQEGETWKLTDTGQKEADQVKAEMAAKIAEMQKTYVGLSDALYKNVMSHQASFEQLKGVASQISQLQEVSMKRFSDIAGQALRAQEMSMKPLTELMQTLGSPLTKMSEQHAQHMKIIMQPITDMAAKHTKDLQGYLGDFSKSPVNEAAKELQRSLGHIAANPINEAAKELQRSLGHIAASPINKMAQELQRNLMGAAEKPHAIYHPRVNTPPTEYEAPVKEKPAKISGGRKSFKVGAKTILTSRVNYYEESDGKVTIHFAGGDTLELKSEEAITALAALEE